LIFAKALGAEVVAISHSPSKEADAKKMGASKFIATSKSRNFPRKTQEQWISSVYLTFGKSV
jgi:D-arabinose 1-dehydrogenase-like Zn-dependent alcohol dehydrogenase